MYHDEKEPISSESALLVSQLIADKEYVDYATYAKFRDLLYWE